MRCTRLLHTRWLLLPLLAVLTGCHITGHTADPGVVPVPPIGGDMPRELSKVVLPTYTIEPPDILVIGVVSSSPRPNYRLRSGDTLYIKGTNLDYAAPVDGPFVIQPDGSVDLGTWDIAPPLPSGAPSEPILVTYGRVRVVGLTAEEAAREVELALRAYKENATASVSLLQSVGAQQIVGEHLVGPDGTVTLGSYGSVLVVGMTVDQAKSAIEAHLSSEMQDPEVSVTVYQYNSKKYYVITQGAGLGDAVIDFPITGNDTVLDAISRIDGLTQVSSKRIWIARPSPHHGDVQILPVDWSAVTGLASTSTNYQLLPGDRVFIAEDRLVALDTQIGKLLAPIERVMGFTLLGTSTVTRLSGRVLAGGGDQRSRGF